MLPQNPFLAVSLAKNCVVEIDVRLFSSAIAGGSIPASSLLARVKRGQEQAPPLKALLTGKQVLSLSREQTIKVETEGLAIGI